MSIPPIYSVVLSLLPCLIPPYALRLSRSFGTRKVGWTLFAAFALLALLQLIRAWHPMGLGLDPGLTLDLLNLMVPVLLLVGMIHLEMVFRDRRALEEQERQLRAGLELQVQERTAALDKVNEELQSEISMRRIGEAELRKSKEHYRFLFDENPQPMWIYDLVSFRLLAFNAAAVRHLGYSGAEFREMTAKDLCAPGEMEAFTTESGKPMTGLQPQPLRRLLKRDGSVIEVELAALDLTYAERPARLVLANDVTAHRLLQKQSLQAQKLQVITQLAGGVADNFSQLLTGIESEAASLAQNSRDLGAAGPLKRIAATAAAAAGLNRQLLALVRRHPMRMQTLDLNKLIEKQNGSLSRILGKKIIIEKSYWSGLPAINADPALVEQILRQLVQNAGDAMPDGGTLSLTTAAILVDDAYARKREEARPGTFVCLSVADTGCGMSAEIQARLFEPFFTTKEPSRATGLGLATVHGLVKQHSGWIEVNSAPSVGSRFTVFFPCVPAAPVKNGQGEAIKAG